MKTILLVEDVPTIAAVEKMMLKNHGYNVVVANTGEKAIEMAQEPSIDLILMDIDLGMGINGPTAAKVILKKRDIPLLFLSAHTETEIVALTEKITSYGYVVKNSGITVLDASIKMAFKLFDANQKIMLEKELLRTTLNSIGEGVISTDVQGIIQKINPLAERLTGWAAEQALGKKIGDVFNIIDVQTRASIGCLVQKILESNSGFDLSKNPLLFSNRVTEFRIACLGSPILAHEGSVVGVVLVFRDVSEEYVKQRTLQKSEYLFRESQRVANIGSYFTDFVQGHWESSEVLDEIFGIDKSYQRNINGWLELVYEKDRELLGKYLEQEVILNRQPFNKEYRISRKSDGAVRWVSGLGEVKFDDKGNILSLIGTIQDITERKRIEAMLHEQNKLHAMSAIFND